MCKILFQVKSLSMNQISYNLFLFFLFTLFAFRVSSESVVINGTAEKYKNSEISLFIQRDYFSAKEDLLFTSMIDSNGIFMLKTNIASTKKAFLKIDNIASTLYLEPGKSYQVNFPGVENGEEIAGNINYVKLKILNQDSKELNFQINAFNDVYDKFIEDHYSLIIRKMAKDKINEFVVKTAKDYSNIQDAFLKNYIDYSIASLEQLAFSSKNKLYKQYLHSKPVLHNNPEYALFFREFYLNYLLSLSESTKGSAIQGLINTQKDYTGLMSELKRDSLLQDEELRELVLILGLQEIYENKEFNKKSINYLLKVISEKSEFSENRNTARNILYLLTQFDPGQKAPAFALIDSDGNNVSLEQFKGKYVYLNFWASWCNSCVQEFPIMSDLYNKYSKDIIFISVSSDKKWADFINFTKNNNYSWKFLHYGGSKKIMDDYEARALPAYFLISPEGYFIEAPAASPSEGIEEKFQEVIGTPKTYKKKKVGEK